MKKSTLTKLICLAILCIMVLPFVVACGTSYTVYFDANGGVLDEKDATRKVKQGEVIGKLPNPTKEGHIFKGWFDEDDLNFEDKFSAKDLVPYDMTLVAKWEVDENSVTVEFDPDGGVFEGIDGSYIKYVTKGATLGTLPANPEKEGYEFAGWYLESDRTTQYRQTTKIKDSTILIAKWTMIVYCTSGKDDHDWAGWTPESTASCDTASIDSNTCLTCGHIKYKENQPALGHKWTKWDEAYLQRVRTCRECNEQDFEDFENVTTKALGVGKTPTIDGDVWDRSGPGVLIDGVLQEDGSSCFCGTGKGSITVTFDFEAPMAIDIIYVTGLGAASYTVTVTYEDGTTGNPGTGVGSFSSKADGFCSFDNEGKVITKVEIFMESCSIGQDYWTEVAFGKKPTDK